MNEEAVKWLEHSYGTDLDLLPLNNPIRDAPDEYGLVYPSAEGWMRGSYRCMVGPMFTIKNDHPGHGEECFWCTS